MSKSPYQQIAIIGCGLIGGSLAQLIAQQHPSTKRYAVDPNADSLKSAKEQGVIHEGVSTIDALPTALDLVIIATPISLVNSTLQALTQHITSPCVFTDVASTKTDIGRDISLAPQHTLIPGHPMAGKETNGYHVAEADMLHGATYILTAPASAQRETFDQFLTELGFKVLHLDAKQHDTLVAYASHLPYIMACLTTLSAQQLAQDAAFKSVISTGFQSTTRLAGSSTEWGKDVAIENSRSLLDGLSQLEDHIRTLKDMIQHQDAKALKDFFNHAQHIRRDIYNI